MARCVNCQRDTASPLNYDTSRAGTSTVLHYIGDSVAPQFITGPSGQNYTYSSKQPYIVIDAGDAEALLALEIFEEVEN